MNLPSPFALFLLVLAVAASAGCSSQGAAPAPDTNQEAARPVQIEVGGTPGMRFEGTLGEPPEGKAIAGQVPASFSVEMRRAIFVRVQKAVQDGQLTVRVLVDGTEVASAVTTKPFGLVALSYPARPRAR